MTRVLVSSAAAFSVVVLLTLGACSSTEDGPLPLIPRPAHLELSDAPPLALADGGLVVSGELGSLERAVVRMFEERFAAEAGVQLTLGTEGDALPPDALPVTVTVDPDGPPRHVSEPDPPVAEDYRLVVTHEGVRLRAGSSAGMQYGLDTLLQLVTFGREKGGVVVPALEIEDEPRFAYRGMHLDVGRHFFTVEEVRRYIDLLARYRFNQFHWHLTEDQGWRVEVERYPKLVEVGSQRRETILEKNFDPYVGDGTPHGGYYTKDEMFEIVLYAAYHHINVIPEIELPGHSMAALAAYPELACTEGPFEVSTRWGVHDEIYCPKEETFQFLEGVLEEVLEIFQSPLIHIGGDEAPKKRWQESPLAQEVIRREGLADEDELQSYFIGRVASFLAEKGRRIIGWDEILEGGLAPDATVMSWRGIDGGIEAARMGHDVVMTPTSHCYFDYYQGDPATEPLAIGGDLPWQKVYSFEPVPEELTEDEAVHILGAQGNVWTEYIKTFDHVEYMVLPRMLALSEVVWSPKELRDEAHFERRAIEHDRHLRALGFRTRPPSQ